MPTTLIDSARCCLGGWPYADILWAADSLNGLPQGARKLTVKTVDRFGLEFYETKVFEVREKRLPAGWNGDF